MRSVHCFSLAALSADYAALSKSLMKKAATGLLAVIMPNAAPNKALPWKQAIYLPGAMTFPVALHHVQSAVVMAAVEAVAVGAVAVMAEAAVAVAAVVDHVAQAVVVAAAAVTAVVAAVVVTVAAEVTPAAVAACLAKAIPRAAVTKQLLRCSTAYEN